MPLTPEDLEHRRRQVHLFVWAIEAAREDAYASTYRDDRHTITHFFRRPSPADQMPWGQWLDEFEFVLIPELERREGWKELAPDVIAIFNIVKDFEHTPQWGCRLCY